MGFSTFSISSAAVGDGEIPDADDHLRIGDDDLSIVAVLPVSSGEQYALHKLVVRR